VAWRVVVALGCLGLGWEGAAPAARGSVAEWGCVNFSTRITGQVDAQVFVGDPGGALRGADGRYFGQLYAGRTNEAPRPVGIPVRFRTGAGQGYITAGGAVSVPGLRPGESAMVELRMWHSALGASFEEAIERSGLAGSKSAPIAVVLGTREKPANLVGLSGFVWWGVWPVPSPPAVVLWPANGHGYQRVIEPGLSWEAARSAAATNRHAGWPGHLVTIGSREESGFLRDHPELGAGPGFPLHGFWIGAGQDATAAEPGGGWAWETGEPWDFAHWRDGQPDDGEAGEDAVLLEDGDPSGDLAWCDAPSDGSRALGYLIEFEPEIPPVLSVNVLGSRLRLGWAKGRLEQAENLAGPWQGVEGAVSPWVITPTGFHRFYRLRP
jgi:hypothetical protein